MSSRTARLGAADCICLAAAPTFAAMALLTVLLGSDAPAALCAAQPSSPLSGMVPMYVLMSVFHLAPWLKLLLAQQEKTNERGLHGRMCLRRDPVCDL
jgi:hypothetical protein